MSKNRSRRGWIAGTVVIVVIVSALVLKLLPTFGGTANAALLQKMQASSHYVEGAFVNVVAQSGGGFGERWQMLQEQFGGEQIRVPQAVIPVVPLRPASLQTPPQPGMRAVWIGHAGVMVEIDGLRVMVDPVFSERASPFSFVGPQRFHPTPIALQDLPSIDAVMISHDHYDHLDMKTIQHLAAKGTHFFVPLGVGAHLLEWGVAAQQINDMHWWDSKTVGGVKIISTPSRHYSGRDLFDYKKTFWSSWSIVGPQHRFYYSGDSGFSDHFQNIGERLGPFDLTIIKIGAYGPGAQWLDVHMSPEHAVEAHHKLRGQRMLPVHWATFNMAFHDWDEPIKRTLRAAALSGAEVVTPRVGETVTAGRAFESQRWWTQLESPQ